MKELISSFKPDLRISPAWVIALMIAAGVALGLVTQVYSNAVERGKWQDLVLLLFLLTLLTWGLSQWQPSLGRWAVIITLVMIVYWGQQWLQVPGFLTLLVIPTALAAALIGLPAGFIITIGETALMLSADVLMNDVLDLSQIDTDKMALTKEQAPFKEIVEEATTSIRPLYVSKGLYLTIDISENLPPIFCDRTRIREVLLNLLSNAGRFTEHGGVSVRVWTEGNDLTFIGGLCCL